MTESNLMYGITLENYSSPRYTSDVSLYCGTREELDSFLENLSGKDWTESRYAPMLGAFQDPSERTYSLFGKDYPVEHRLQLLYTQEDFLKDHEWTCCTDDDSIYHLYASKVIVSRILAQDSEQIYRFLRARFTGLQVNLQGQGWVELKDQFIGFPGIYSYENNQHVMNLYICDAVYETYDERIAMQNMKKSDTIDLLNAMQDILGEGLQ